MDIEIQSVVVELQAQQCLRLCGAAGVRIVCRSGTLWVTQAGVWRDDFLYPDAVLALETSGLTLVQAMAPATFAIESPVRPPRPRSPAIPFPWSAVLATGWARRRC